MLVEPSPLAYSLEATGGGIHVSPPAEYVVHLETAGTGTPSPYAWEPLLNLGTGTECHIVEIGDTHLVERAFGFMGEASRLLPYSEDADKVGDALIDAVRGDPGTRRLTRKSNG